MDHLNCRTCRTLPDMSKMSGYPLPDREPDIWGGVGTPSKGGPTPWPGLSGRATFFREKITTANVTCALRLPGSSSVKPAARPVSDVQTQLVRCVAKPATSDATLKAMAARAWHDFGIALFKPQDLPNHFDRQAVIHAAERLYGKRRDRTRKEGNDGYCS